MPTLRLAHRGDWRRAPENTIAAFLAALDVPGCDGLEFDVRAAADGVPGRHPRRDARPRPGRRRAGRRSSAPTSSRAHGVPTLEEVLAAVPRRAFLDVELKGDPGRGAVDVLTAGRGPGLERAVVSSFEPATLERVGRLAPSWPRWLNAIDLSADTIALARVALGCRGISVEWRAIDARSVGARARAGLEVAAWTVRRRPTYDRLERLGVVAVCVEAARARRLTPESHGETRRPGRPRARTPAGSRRRDLSHRRTAMTTADRADLVVVGAGTIGGWASVLRRGRTAPAGSSSSSAGSPGWAPASRAAGHRPGPGRDARDRRARPLVDRLLPRARRRRIGTDSGLPRARLPDPRGDRGRRAGRPRAGRDAAARGPRRRLARPAAEAAALVPTLVAGRPPRRQLPRDRRPHRPAAQRPCLLARDAGGGRRAARADGVHRAAHRADGRRRPAGRRRRDERRPDRDGAGAADRRPVAAGRRPGGRASGSRPARPATRSPCSSRTRRSTSSGCRWSSTSARACTGGSRRAGCCSAGATRTRRPARRARSTGRCTSDARARLADFVPITRDLGLRRIWAATIDYTPDHLPILGPALTADGVADRRRHGRLAGRPRDDVGTGRRPRRRRPRAHAAGRTSIDVTDLGPRPLRRAGPEPPRDRSDRAAVPARRRRTPLTAVPATRVASTADRDPDGRHAARSSRGAADGDASRSARSTAAGSRRSASTAGS